MQKVIQEYSHLQLHEASKTNWSHNMGFIFLLQNTSALEWSQTGNEESPKNSYVILY